MQLVRDPLAAMSTKRKPTLKQLFSIWKKHRKKSDELWKIKHELDSIAGKLDYSSELIRDGDYVYKVTAKGRYGSYAIEELALANELNTLLINS